MRVILAVLVASLSLMDRVTTPGQGVTQWPAIQPYDEVFKIENPSKAVVRTFLRDTAGKPLYLFVCRTGEDESVPDVNYAGDLDCRLIPAEAGEVESNLLIEAPDLAAWYSRGRMFASELQGDCAEYPEYGRERNFHLRGLRLTMRFEDVSFAAPVGDGKSRLASYALRVRAVRDEAAVCDIAASSGYLDPSRSVPGDPRSCSIVRKGNEWDAP